MNKNIKIKKKINKFSPGGEKQTWGEASASAASEAFSGKNIGGTIAGMAGAASGLLGTAMKNAQIDASAQEAELEAVKAQNTTGSSLDAIEDMWQNTMLANTDINWHDVRGMSGGQMVGNTLGSIASGASAGASVGGPWGAVAGAVVGLGSSLAGIFSGNKKAKRKAAELNRLGQEQNETMLANVGSNIDNVIMNEINKDRINIAAYGGKIHIKPSKRGTFTAAAKQRGLGVQEFASKVLANPDNYSEAMRKKAQFAKNASKWHHSYGGPLNSFTGDFTNGVTFIDEGGTHEQNPFEGVMVGVDNEGTPNLVEEGEVIWNDYVFSNRLKPSKKQLEDGGYTKYKDWTFAKIAEDFQKASAETPNDKISIDSLNDRLNFLISLQEEVRDKKGVSDNNKFAKGGLPEYVEVTEEPSDEDESIFDTFWGAAKTPEQRMAIMDLDPTNAYQKPKKEGFNWGSLGRYAPIVAGSASLLNNIFQKPDYSNVNAGLIAMQNVPTVEATHIGGKQQYTPVDKSFLLNKQLNANRAAARDIQNQAVTGSQALAHLANLNYNNQTALADAALTMDRENLARKMQAAQFNLGIDQYNASQDMTAKQLNQQRGYNIAQAAANAGQLREAINSQRGQAISADMSGLASDLAGIGTEAEHKAWLNNLVKTGAIEDYLKAARASNSGKNGGKLLTKKRK